MTRKNFFKPLTVTKAKAIVAKNDPKKFFQAADRYEGKGNRRYREIEFALPNELKTVEQYRQIIDAFIEKHLKRLIDRLSRKNIITVRRKIGIGLKNLFLLFFVQIALKYKMKCWKKMDFQFVLTIEL